MKKSIKKGMLVGGFFVVPMVAPLFFDGKAQAAETKDEVKPKTEVVTNKQVENNKKVAQQSTGEIVTQNGKQYYKENDKIISDVTVNKDDKKYYFEPVNYGSNMAKDKWSYGQQAKEWYYSDKTGNITKEIVNDKNNQYYKENGKVVSDTTVALSKDTKYYFDTKENGSAMTKNKWSYSNNSKEWYHSDQTGTIDKEIVNSNGKKYYKENGKIVSDKVVAINNMRYYFEPATWGSNMAINKWSYGQQTKEWYYSDATGNIVKEIVRVGDRQYYKENGKVVSDVVVSLSKDMKYYFEPTNWGSNMAKNKWSYGQQTKNWYYSDGNGTITKSIVNENGKQYYKEKDKVVSDVVVSLSKDTKYYFEPASYGSNMAKGKWSYGQQSKQWYLSRENGTIERISYKYQGEDTLSKQVVQYYQNDSRWKNKVYGPASLAISGCVPTSLAMAISTLSKTVTPVDVADYLYYKTPYFNKAGAGTYQLGVSSALNNWGLNYKVLYSSNEVKDYLKRGYVVLGAVQGTTFTTPTGTHAIILNGYEGGQTKVHNPLTYRQSKLFDIDYIWSSRSSASGDRALGSQFVAIYK